MNAMITVRPLAESEYQDWRRLVEDSPEGSIYSTSEYLRALCAATGGRFTVLAAFRGNELAGGVALYEERARWGTVVSPRLLLFYNGLVLRARNTRYPSKRAAEIVEITKALETAIRRSGYARVCLKQRSSLNDVRVFQDRGWRARPTYTMMVPLVDLDAQWGRVDQNLRRLIKRCAKMGIRCSEDDDFASFFRMHLETHLRKRMRLYLPEDAFARFFRALHENGLGRLFHARLPDGESIASQLVLVSGHPVSHTVAAAADAAHLGLGANAFLRWKVFETLAQDGFSANDLTSATLDTVTRFKSQLGGTLETCLEVERIDSVPMRIGEVFKKSTGRIRGLVGRVTASTKTRSSR